MRCWSFAARHGLLHASGSSEDVCLYVACGSLPSLGEQRRALARLVGEATSSGKGVDGRAAPPCEEEMRLVDAIATLVSAKAKVRVESFQGRSLTPGATQTGRGHLRSVVARKEVWAPDALVRRSSEGEGGEEGRGRDRRPICAEPATEGHVYDVFLADPLPLVDLLAPPVAWRDVFHDGRSYLRVGTRPLVPPADQQPPSPSSPLPRLKVTLYRAGLLWREDVVEDEAACETLPLEGVHLLVDAGGEGGGDSCSSPHLAWLPPFPSRIDADGADAFACAFLHASRAEALSLSEVARSLAHLATPWRSLLAWRIAPCRKKRGDDAGVVDVLRNAAVCDELVRLVDGRHLLAHTARHPGIDLAGTAVLRRTQPVACSRTADWRGSTLGEFAVCRFEVVPLPSSRFETVHRLGCLAFADRSCPHGALVRMEGGGSGRVVLVPCDATPRTLSLAVAHLLAAHDDLESMEALPPLLLLAPAETQCEHAAACAPDEEVVPYRVRLDVGRKSVLLVRDEAIPARRTSLAVGLDDLATLDVARDPRRTRQADVRAVFPALANRLDSQREEGVSAAVLACGRDAAARRLAREWSLEGVDVGQNLSSLGLSLLLAIGLAGWAGCRVRLFLSPTRAAVVGVWCRRARGRGEEGDEGDERDQGKPGDARRPDGIESGETELRLVDPSRTLVNAFDLAPSLARLPESGREVAVRKGMLIEVRAVSRWYVACVVDVQPQFGSVKADILATGKRVVLSRASHAWRRLARDDASDVDLVVRRLVHGAGETGEEGPSLVARECPPSKKARCQ